MISEKIELLGKGLYKTIPDELTLKAIPTVSELEYVSSEEFEKTMLDNIFPVAIEEKCNFHELLEIDFQWICRCLRLLNYGPYHTTNAIICSKCGYIPGEARVDLRTVACKPLPEGFVNEIKLTKDEFIDFKGDVTLHLPTIQEVLNAYSDKLFQTRDGNINRDYARLCYMVTAVGKDKDLSPVTIKTRIEKDLSSADFMILKQRVLELTDYGLRAGGLCTCPKCGGETGRFLALVDDRFFRPTLGDLRSGKALRSARGTQEPAGAETATV